jgi:hypothetical protein
MFVNLWGLTNPPIVNRGPLRPSERDAELSRLPSAADQAQRARPLAERSGDDRLCDFVIATITAVAGVARLLPAWRASRVDPNIVLRDE